MKKYPIKNAESAFGTLNYLSCEGPVNETVGFGKNAKAKVIGYKYNLLSSEQDDVTVFVPSTIPRVDYNYMQVIELNNAELVAKPMTAQRNAYIEWEVFANGIVIKK